MKTLFSRSFIRRCYSKKPTFSVQSQASTTVSEKSNEHDEFYEQEAYDGSINRSSSYSPIGGFQGSTAQLTPKIQSFKSFQVKSLVHLQKQNDSNHNNLGIIQNKHIVDTKPVVVLLATDKHNHIMVLHVDRSSSLEENNKLIELPHFELNKNDDPRERIKEELLKFGLNTSNSIIYPVNDYYTMPHFSSQRFFVYLVQNCETDASLIEDKPHLHPVSSIYLEWIEPKKVKQLIEQGLIHDAKTGVALSQIILHYYFTSPGFFSLGKLIPFGIGLILGSVLVYIMFLSRTIPTFEKQTSLLGGKEYEETAKSQMRKSGHL